jgi:peptidoglycan lytic transglycosylase
MCCTRQSGRIGRAAALGAMALALVAVTGCRRHRAAYNPPPQALPPPAEQPTHNSEYAYQPTPRVYQRPAPIPITRVPPGGVSQADLEYVATHRPILSQVGLASWYTAPYPGRKAANGQVFNDWAMTAANRTLPMGSLIVITNLETGQSGAMRITDRGPFVDGRIVDLTIASAEATGIYRAGLTRVRMDVYKTPKPINTGGRWCVQVGAFSSERKAMALKKRLMREYPDANVIEFPGEKSYWVRIRPQGDDRAMAEYIARHLHPSQGDAFLTRLD